MRLTIKIHLLAINTIEIAHKRYIKLLSFSLSLFFPFYFGTNTYLTFQERSLASKRPQATQFPKNTFFFFPIKKH